MILKPLFSNKKFKYLLITFAVLIVIVIAISSYFAYAWHPMLTRVIKENIYESTDRLYRINFSNIRVNILTGNVVMDNISLKPDMKRYELLKKLNKAPNNLFELDVKRLVLQRVKPFKVYFKKELSINSIRIKKPTLTISYYHNRPKSDINYNSNPYLLISRVLKSLSIKNILLDEIDFKHIDYLKTGKKTTAIKNLSIGFENLFINKTSYRDTSKVLSSENIFVILKDYTYSLPKSIYNVYVGSLIASTQKKSLTITNLKLQSKINKEAFYKTLKTQKDFYNVQFGKVSLLNLNIREFIDNRLLHASVLNLSHADISVFLNRSFPKPDIDKGVNYPHLALKRLDQRIKIDTTKLFKLNISYGEYNPKTKSSGAVKFQNLSGFIFNISNDDSSLVKNKLIRAYLHTSLMGQGFLKVDLKFNMLSDKADFSYKGRLTNMPAKAINPVSKKLALMSIKTGHVKDLYFNINGDINGAGGYTRFLYNDLAVDLLKKNDEQKVKKQGLISILANSLIIKDHNPEEGEKPRSATVYFKRPPDASFFNLMWNTVFMGIKQNIGLTPKMESQVKEKVKFFKKMKDNQQARQKRRALRKQKRQEDSN